jgi:hypothetical protein
LSVRVRSLFVVCPRTLEITLVKGEFGRFLAVLIVGFE